MYEITVTQTFHAQHAIRLDDGSWEPPHAHDWRAQVTAAADRLNDIETVMDFHELERLVDQITNTAHQGDLNKINPFADGRISPTAERVAWWISERLANRLPDGIRLKRVSVTEAPGCTASYIPDPD